MKRRDFISEAALASVLLGNLSFYRLLAADKSTLDHMAGRRVKSSR